MRYFWSFLRGLFWSSNPMLSAEISVNIFCLPIRISMWFVLLSYSFNRKASYSHPSALVLTPGYACSENASMRKLMKLLKNHLYNLLRTRTNSSNSLVFDTRPCWRSSWGTGVSKTKHGHLYRDHPPNRYALCRYLLATALTNRPFGIVLCSKM